MLSVRPVLHGPGHRADQTGDRRPFTFLTIETTAPQLKKCTLWKASNELD
jgi:hypothetical protein